MRILLDNCLRNKAQWSTLTPFKYDKRLGMSSIVSTSMISFLSGLVFYWLAVFLLDRIKYKNPNYERLIFFIFGALSVTLSLAITIFYKESYL